MKQVDSWSDCRGSQLLLWTEIGPNEFLWSIVWKSKELKSWRHFPCWVRGKSVRYVTTNFIILFPNLIKAKCYLAVGTPTTQKIHSWLNLWCAKIKKNFKCTTLHYSKQLIVPIIVPHCYFSQFVFLFYLWLSLSLSLLFSLILQLATGVS